MTNKQRICFTTFKFFPEWGGLARSASRLTSYLIEAGFEVHVVVPSFQSDDSGKTAIDFNHCLNSPEVVSEDLYIYRPLITDKETMMGTLTELLLLLDLRFHFQLFHGYYLPFAFPSLAVAAHGNRPVIASIRGNDAVKEGMSSIYFPYVQAVLNRATWITSVSTDLLRNTYGLADIQQRSSVIFNGIDSTGFPRWKGFDETQGIVGTVGELRFKKAIPILIDGYNKIPKPLRKKLILGGAYSDPQEECIVENLINNLSLGNEVKNTGYLTRQKLLEELVGYNVFVVNSYHDGLPNTLLEAAACGVPIVATNVGGMMDIIENEKNGLLVPPGAPQKLSEAISRLLVDKELCIKLSSGAYELAQQLNYDQEKNAWLQLYKKMGCTISNHEPHLEKVIG